MSRNGRNKLERHKKKVVESIPPFGEIMRGSLFERKIKCGKSSCHCAKGQGHPTTYLSVTMERGKTIQITVPKKLIPKVQRWINNYQDLWDALEQISEINRQLLRKRLIDSEADE